MQIKTVESLSHSSQNSCHRGNQKQILVRVEAGVGGGKKESVYTAGENTKLLCHWKSIWKFFFLKKNYKWNYIIQIYHS